MKIVKKLFDFIPFLRRKKLSKMIHEMTLEKKYRIKEKKNLAELSKWENVWSQLWFPN